MLGPLRRLCVMLSEHRVPEPLRVTTVVFRVKYTESLAWQPAGWGDVTRTGVWGGAWESRGHCPSSHVTSRALEHGQRDSSCLEALGKAWHRPLLHTPWAPHLVPGKG